MRKNGLHAAAYIAVADLHPMLADLMLDALADEGVAAYAAPAPHGGHRGPSMDRVLPNGPTDRLWVDRLETVRARALLRERLPALRADLERATAEPSGGPAARPEPDPPDVLVDDATWEGIVASFQTTADPDAPRSWPSVEDVEDEERDATSGDEPASRDAAAGSATDQDADGWADLLDSPQPGLTRRTRPASDSADHFVPPPPPPLPVADRTTRLAWAGVIGGPLLFFLALLLGWQLSSLTQLAGVAALVGGFITLVTRMHDRDDDEPDDGAVV